MKYQTEVVGRVEQPVRIPEVGQFWRHDSCGYRDEIFLRIGDNFGAKVMPQYSPADRFFSVRVFDGGSLVVTSRTETDIEILEPEQPVKFRTV